MKYNCWLVLGIMLSTSLLAQEATDTAPPAAIQMPVAAPPADLAPAAAKTNAPAAKAAKKKSTPKMAHKAPVKKAPARKTATWPELRTMPLVAGPAMVVASNVNVRGQAKLKSEIVTQVTKGQTVTVIEEIVRNNSGPDEPSAWAKITLPPGARAWVHNAYLKAADQTVVPRRLNLRSGPGENYSVIGLLHRGDVVKPIITKEDWTEIEPPAIAYAFVAAQYLSQEALPPSVPTPTAVTAVPPVAPPPEPPPAPATVTVIPPGPSQPVEPPPTPTTVAADPTVAPPPAEHPALPPPTATPDVTTLAETPAAPSEPEMIETPEEEEEPLPPRIVEREGIVRGMTSIQAPSPFVLVSPETGRNIDYLYTTSRQLDLRRYKGLRIIVTGEEALDERWGTTPVITIQKIQVVE